MSLYADLSLNISHLTNTSEHSTEGIVATLPPLIETSPLGSANMCNEHNKKHGTSNHIVFNDPQFFAQHKNSNTEGKNIRSGNSSSGMKSLKIRFWNPEMTYWRGAFWRMKIRVIFPISFRWIPIFNFSRSRLSWRQKPWMIFEWNLNTAPGWSGLAWNIW